MKPELNIQNKAKFFAQYLYQCIAIDVLYHESKLIPEDFIIEDHTDDNIENIILQLRPLSKISSEHAIEVGRMLGYNTQPDFVIREKGKTFCGIGPMDKGFNYHPYDALLIFDYLRSQGYAIPWMGYTVEELVKAGWVKLKK